MTVEELRKEANKQGFELVKRDSWSKWVKKHPCTCGRRTHFTLIFDPAIGKYFYVCPTCRFVSRAGSTIEEAGIFWNEDIERRQA